MWLLYIRVAVAVAPAASVPLLPTPFKKATCTFTGWMAS